MSGVCSCMSHMYCTILHSMIVCRDLRSRCFSIVPMSPLSVKDAVQLLAARLKSTSQPSGSSTTVGKHVKSLGLII